MQSLSPTRRLSAIVALVAVVAVLAVAVVGLLQRPLLLVVAIGCLAVVVGAGSYALTRIGVRRLVAAATRYGLGRDIASLKNSPTPGTPGTDPGLGHPHRAVADRRGPAGDDRTVIPVIRQAGGVAQLSGRISVRTVRGWRRCARRCGPGRCGP